MLLVVLDNRLHVLGHHQVAFDDRQATGREFADLGVVVASFFLLQKRHGLFVALDVEVGIPLVELFARQLSHCRVMRVDAGRHLTR